MNSIGRFHLNAILRAAIGATAAAFYPSLDIGQNMPGDYSGGTMRVFNDRTLAAVDWYTADFVSGFLPTGSRDATTGLPTTAFSYKLAEGSLAASSTVTGTWLVIYSASAQRNITSLYGGISVTAHTFSGGVGKFQFTYAAGGSALLLVFNDGGVTALQSYDPTISASAIAGNTPPRWNAQFLRTTQPYAYFRFMDVMNANGEGASVATGFPLVVNWTDRTPSAYPHKAKKTSAANTNMGEGYPLEWLIDLCAQSGKSGWFNIPLLASDDYITQMATLIAQTMAAGLWAGFELGNECWNTAPGFYCYRKAGAAAATECLASQAYASEWGVAYPQQVVSFSSDGTTATVVYAQAHLATTGNLVKAAGFNSGYTGFMPGAGVTLTVVNTTTVTYPCTQASTGGTVAASTVMPYAAYLALNGASTLFASNGISSIYSLRELWFWRRSYQMAQLVKAAFAAVGRAAADCRPILASNAGNAYYYGNKHAEDLLNAITGTTVRLGDSFAAACVGGYLTLVQTNVINPGFASSLSQGVLKGASDASLTTEAAVAAQLQEFTDHAFATFCYQQFVSWCRWHGMEAWGYEIGNDLAPSGGETTPMRTAKEAYQNDYATYGAQQEAMYLAWIRNFQTVGFTKIGWYQCGAGTFATYGTFNLGRTADEIDYTTPAANRSPKFNAIIDAATPPVAPVTRHAFPCVLSGYDVVGNEAVNVPTPGIWPNLNGNNMPAFQFNYGYQGPGVNGQTYGWIWSETTQACTLTILGDNTSGANQTVNVKVLGTSSAASFVAPHNTTNGVLGSVVLMLQPGPNYVFVYSTGATSIYPHSLAFA